MLMGGIAEEVFNGGRETAYGAVGRRQILEEGGAKIELGSIRDYESLL